MGTSLNMIQGPDVFPDTGTVKQAFSVNAVTFKFEKTQFLHFKNYTPLIVADSLYHYIFQA